MMEEVNSCDKPEKETIHSGHFMVSHFEAEEQDDEDDVAVPVPEAEIKNPLEPTPHHLQFNIQISGSSSENKITNQQLSIETSLSKLFQCMSLAYRQKLTSPKWNRFRGIRLRWKDKIRLNNVIWRCWHMQFIMKQNTLICQFASPLDVDQHNKPEAVVLEGKYWKRKLQAVTAEYKKWRMYYRNQVLGCINKDLMERLEEPLSWNSQSNDALNMMVDEDYMDFMSDTLFSTIGNQPFVFPDSREIAKAGLADFIQPSLGPLQPNLDDIMDTLEPLNDLINAKLPPVPEEQANDGMGFKSVVWDFPEYSIPANATSDVGNSFPTLELENDKIHTANKESAEYSDENIQQTQHKNIGCNLTVISRINSNKNITRHIKITSTKQQQQQDNIIYKHPLSYSNYPASLSELNDKPVININENVQRAAPPSANVLLSNVKDQNDTGPAAQPDKDAALRREDYTSGVPMKTFVGGMVKLEDDIKIEKSVNHRRRSRSTTRETQRRPLLISAVSEPAIINANNSSVLLTQLLTSNNRRSTLPTVINNSTLIKHEQLAIALPASMTKALSGSTCDDTNIVLSSTLNQSSNNSSPDLNIKNSLDSPESEAGLQQSGGRNIESPGCDSNSPNRDRRVGHIHAEQKRRYNIKNGFDMIHTLIPQLNQNPNTKLSKAAMLQKGADYIRQLRSERNQLKEEMDALRQQIECLNMSISNCQSMLPVTGAPVSRKHDSRTQEMFEEYVKNKTLENWKFWIFSLMIKPLLVSYNNFVSTSSLEDLYRSTLLWIEQQCTLVDLRPIVLNSLRYLCTKTDILTHPEKLSNEARKAVMSTKTAYS